MVAWPLLVQAISPDTSTFATLQQSRAAKIAFDTLRTDGAGSDSAIQGQRVALRASADPDRVTGAKARDAWYSENLVKPGPNTGLGLKPGRVLQRGVASWYGPGFHGRTTANGERFDQNEMTAAHKTLPFNTRVVVRNTRNGREVVVRINDRGPYIDGRIIDLSKAAAKALGMVERGHDMVVLHRAITDDPDAVVAGFDADALNRM